MRSLRWRAEVSHVQVDMEVRPKKKAGGLWAGRLHHWDSEMHICAGVMINGAICSSVGRMSDSELQVEMCFLAYSSICGTDMIGVFALAGKHGLASATTRVLDSACTHNIWGSSAGLLSPRTGHGVNVIRIGGTIKAQCEGGHVNPAADEIYVCSDVKTDLASAP